MAHHFAADTDNSRRKSENNYDLISSLQRRCNCCPYGFHVDNSFVNYTESMKKGKSARVGPIIHGGRSVHLLPNPAPDLHLPNESVSFNGSAGDDSHDSFAVFGTTTERRKKQRQHKLSADFATLTRSASSHGRILDISMPNNSNAQHNSSSNSSRGRSLSSTDQINANSHTETRHVVTTEINPEPCRDPNCPENRPHNTVYCSNLPYCCNETTTTCLECCDDVFCQANEVPPPVQAPPPMQAPPPPQAPPQIVLPDVTHFKETSVFPSPPETAKVEMDAAKIKEIREYMLKCVNHIRLLEERVGKVPVLNARVTSMREEISLLKTRLTAKTQTVTQLTLQLENSQNRMQRQLKLFNAGAQTEDLAKEEPRKKAPMIEKSTSPAKDFEFLTNKSSQTLSDPLQVVDEMPRASAPHKQAAPSRPHGNVRETYIPPLEDMPLARDRPDGRRPVEEVVSRSKVERKEASQSFKPKLRDTGVGGHDIREIYCLDPKRLRVSDLPPELESLLKSRWEASLPKKPRMFNVGIDHVPQWRHKSAQATPKLVVSGVGDHDVDRVYFVNSREMSAEELPPALVRQMKVDWEDALPPKPPVVSLGVSAVPQCRSQGEQVAPELQTVALGRHDVGAMYFLQPEFLRTSEIPREAVAALHKEWEEALPKPPTKEDAESQCEPPKSVEQCSETDRPRVCSMGVGDHSVNRLYFQEYEEMEEQELPIEAFTIFREAWREEWERCLPAKPKMVSTSVTFSHPTQNKLVNTEPRRAVNCGVGDRDVSKIYFLGRPAHLEDELPSWVLKELKEAMYECVMERMPKKPHLTESSVVYHNPTGMRSVGIGDHEVDQLYFLSPHKASALDIPLHLLNVIRSEWSSEMERQTLPKNMAATSITDLVGLSRSIGTMSEEPRTAMFDESVGVNLDEEEWDSLDESSIAWSPRHGSWSSKSGSLKVVIEKLRHSYRFNKAEFVGHLTRLVAREVKSRESQTDMNSLTESTTEYEATPGEPPKTLVHRAVSDDTINVDVVLRSMRMSCGTQYKPLCFDKVTYTDHRRTFSRAVLTDKTTTRDRCINYEPPKKPRDAACITDRIKTRDIFVWADLLSSTPALPKQEDTPPSREEGGRHDHYLVSNGESRSSSLGNEPVGCSPEETRTRGTVLGGHSHTHVHGTDPAANSSPTSPQWSGRGSSPRSSTNKAPPPPSRGSSSLDPTGKGEVRLSGQSSGLKPIDPSKKSQDSFVHGSVTETTISKSQHSSLQSQIKIKDSRTQMTGKDTKPSSLTPGKMSDSATTPISIDPQSTTESKIPTPYSSVPCSPSSSPHSTKPGSPTTRNPPQTSSSSTSKSLTTTTTSYKQGTNTSSNITKEPSTPPDRKSPHTTKPESTTSPKPGLPSSIQSRTTISSHSTKPESTTSFKAGTSSSIQSRSTVSSHSTKPEPTTSFKAGTSSSIQSRTTVSSHSTKPEPITSSKPGEPSSIQPRSTTVHSAKPNESKPDSSLSSNTVTAHSIQPASKSSSKSAITVSVTSPKTDIPINAQLGSTDVPHSNTAHVGTISGKGTVHLKTTSFGSEKTSNSVSTFSSTTTSSSKQQSAIISSTKPTTLSSSPASGIKITSTSVGRSSSNNLNQSGNKDKPSADSTKKPHVSSATTTSRTSTFSTTGRPSSHHQSSEGTHRSTEATSSNSSFKVPSSDITESFEESVPEVVLSEMQKSVEGIESDFSMYSIDERCRRTPRTEASNCSLFAQDITHMETTETIETTETEVVETTRVKQMIEKLESGTNQSVKSRSLFPSKQPQPSGSGPAKSATPSAEGKQVPVQTGTSKAQEPAAIVVSDDDSVFTFHQPRGQGRSTRLFSSSSSSPGSGKGRTSKISPRSIMKKTSEDEDSGSNTLLKKKKGIRFAKDTKRKKNDGVFLRSEDVSSSSFSEDDNETEEEGSYEMGIVQKLQDLRADGASANPAALTQSNLSPAMQGCCKTIAEWMTDSTKFTSKQMNEAVSTLRREWFGVSSGRRATPEQTQGYLVAFEQFSPSLLDMVVNFADDNGNTALHYAISREQWAIVTGLLDTNRVRLNRANKAGYTPVMLAALCREVGSNERALMQRLLASGHINQGSSPAGQTALMLAASHGRTEMLQMLLDSGADPNRRDREGSTALMCACEHGHLEAVRKLLASATCDPNMKDNDGSTALSIALENKHRDIALLIYARTNLKDRVATRLLDFRSTQF